MAILNGEVGIYPKVAAKKLGEKAAIVLSTLHYWVQHNKKKKQSYAEGKYWTFNSIREWSEKYFTTWSLSTTRRIFDKLQELGLVISGNFNKSKYDRTKWYTINLEKCKQFFGEDIFIDDTKKGPAKTNEQMQFAKVDQPIPEINPIKKDDDDLENQFDKSVEEIKEQHGPELVNQALEVLKVYPEKTNKPIFNKVSLLKNIVNNAGRYLWMIDVPKVKKARPQKNSNKTEEGNSYNVSADEKKKALIRSLYLS